MGRFNKFKIIRHDKKLTSKENNKHFLSDFNNIIHNKFMM